MTTLIGILALLVGVIGVASLTQATMGVGLIALACLCSIWALIAQASAYRLADLKKTALSSSAL